MDIKSAESTVGRIPAEIQAGGTLDLQVDLKIEGRLAGLNSFDLTAVPAQRGDPVYRWAVNYTYVPATSLSRKEIDFGRIPIGETAVSKFNLFQDQESMKQTPAIAVSDPRLGVRFVKAEDLTAGGDVIGRVNHYEVTLEAPGFPGKGRHSIKVGAQDQSLNLDVAFEAVQSVTIVPEDCFLGVAKRGERRSGMVTLTGLRELSNSQISFSDAKFQLASLSRLNENTWRIGIRFEGAEPGSYECSITIGETNVFGRTRVLVK